ncbi:flagellar biosynthesis protein FlhF [Campylobacter fetus]|uniref:Flagellar biosynthesis protein FlhF n=1 Tax=Campylobacter fetus subsp. testudinum TaxID=1507806 RepID=A0AAX0HCL5_CAMFE|nr:flagellar biosynthesis protein FlhF [Campylobacter fetus]AGZ82311.1 flagellar biosynthesis (GTP-binding) protein [Campylobacter fetus subsp. testudinum 03-427]AJB46034.1 flagellar biosynthesis regulator FlhF [Campylobacter fetus subsp. testudinum]ALV65480.1 flagellar biosynthesis (GTP-binding) protein [Campylobacter fetus subsp. testudinum Sp3]EAI4322050.1 flagellar biosynthesis protein FlhF [Campylobacter fetus]EAI4391684.1 flagellar biosynthesis protein FlhF [Campylobacter fetus]
MATVLKTFTGESAIEALKKAKEECGESAMLVTTKQIQPKTLNKKPVYEILVSVEEETKSPTKESIKEIKQQISAYTKAYEKPPLAPPSIDESVLLNISKAAKEISKVASLPDITIQNQTENEEYNKKIDDVAKQVNKLNDKISMIADMIWDDKAEARGDITIPPEFSTIYKLAKQSGMKSEHLKAIMQTTIQNMPTSMKNNPSAVKRYFYSLLRNMLPCRSESLESKKQRIMMFVGPTGVGKTTTLSKLAYKFAHSGDIRYKTGIITLDTYRLGAVEQLFQYAKIMSIPILDAIELEDFKSALKSLASCDLILIDTMGSSQYDKDKLIKLSSFLKGCGTKIDVNLVLSAGSKIEDLTEIYNNFSFLDIDTLIITKFDETKIFGNVFSLVYDTNTPVSFFSTGQNVPDDIMEAKSEFLVQCVLDGFDKGDEDGSSR